MARELSLRELSFERQKPVPIKYKGIDLDCGYRLDMIIEDQIILELKACTNLEPIHEAQLLTYLKLSGLKLGLLLNFNVPVIKDGIRRIVNHL
jgi:GxxExxY protein